MNENDDIAPQPGPQEAFLTTEADICIYGGSAGGGKTFAILLEPLRNIHNPKFKAVIFRRNGVQVKNAGGLWDESMQLYPLVGGDPKSYNSSWDFPSGATLKFAHLENETTVLNWQGSQIPLICCDENEKVRTPEGLTKISNLKVGDLVMTLQGPKKILAKGKRRLEDCVEFKIGDTHKQVHSVTHKIWVGNGWFSYVDKFYELHPFLIFLSKVFDFFHKFLGQFANIFLTLLQPLYNLLKSLSLKFSIFRLIQDYLDLLGIFFCRVVQGRGNYSELSLYERLKLLLLPSIRFSAIRVLQFHELKGYDFFHASVLRESLYAANELKSVNSQYDYLQGFHQYDEFASQKINNSLNAFRQLGGAGQRTRKGSLLGGLGKVHKHIFRKLQYVHPYRGEVRTAEGVFEHVSILATPCGKKWVCDLTIEDESHYITESGLINKNCFDELTHFTSRQFFYMLSRNRSTSGVRGYIRATTNPDAKSWVRQFIDWYIADDGYVDLSRAGIIRWFVRMGDDLIWADSAQELIDKYGEDTEPKSFTYIPSTIYDNKILLAKDPSYLSSLKAMSRVDRERLLGDRNRGGNWDVVETGGMLFKRDWFEVIDVVPTGHIRSVRYWDRAATKPSSVNPDPDWTRGLLLLQYAKGFFVVADLRSVQDTPAKVEELIKNVASHDGRAVEIVSQQDPGSAGVSESDNFMRMLFGYIVRTEVIGRNKVTRAKPVSAQSEFGNVFILRAKWNEDFFSELENFPDGKHDDIVDVLSGAFNYLTNREASILDNL